MPIRYRDNALVRPTADDIASVRDLVRERRGSIDGFDLVVWAEVAGAPASLAEELPAYEQAGATWWIETARPPRPDWYEQLLRRIRSGPAGDGRV